MKKTRSNAKWLSLNPAQVATLTDWLFTKQMSFEKAFGRAQKELKFSGSLSGLKRFYARIKLARQVEQMTESALAARNVVKAGGGDDQLLAAGMKFVSQQFFEQVREKVAADVPVLAKMLQQNEANQLRRENLALRREAQKLRREQMNRAEQHWQFNAMEAAKEASPLLNRIMTRLEKDKPTPTYKEFIRDVRMRLFGSAPERITPLPEKPAEAAQSAVDAPAGFVFDDAQKHPEPSTVPQPTLPTDASPAPEPEASQGTEL